MAAAGEEVGWRAVHSGRHTMEIAAAAKTLIRRSTADGKQEPTPVRVCYRLRRVSGSSKYGLDG